MDFDGNLLVGILDYFLSNKMKDRRNCCALFFVETYARRGIRQKSTIGFCHFFPYGCSRISRKAHTSKKGEIGGQVCIEPHIFGENPPLTGEKTIQKTLGGNPKCFCYILSKFL